MCQPHFTGWYCSSLVTFDPKKADYMCVWRCKRNLQSLEGRFPTAPPNRIYDAPDGFFGCLQPRFAAVISVAEAVDQSPVRNPPIKEDGLIIGRSRVQEGFRGFLRVVGSIGHYGRDSLGHQTFLSYVWTRFRAGNRNDDDWVRCPYGNLPSKLKGLSVILVYAHFPVHSTPRVHSTSLIN